MWNLATCSKHEALYITPINQSWFFFKQQAFNATVQHVDVCVILLGFCGFIFSGELLKQLGAFRASCRNPKNRIATRSNAWIWRARFWSRLLLKWKLKTASKWPCPKRKAVARGNPIFGSVEPCDLLETRSSLHHANKSKLGFVQAASFQRNSILAP